jgi:hypothetical protein
MWIYVTLRWDIGYSLMRVASFCNNPGPEHWTAVKQIVRYLLGTASSGITYTRTAGGVPKGTAGVLRAFCDADYNGCLDTRRSTTGYIVFLAGGPISWGSVRQKSVSLSTAEAELYAGCDLVRELIWLRAMMAELGFSQSGPTLVHEDNQAFIIMSGLRRLHKRTKHIDTRFHFVREQVADGTIKLEYINSKFNIADLLTKALPAPLFRRLLHASGF